MPEKEKIQVSFYQIDLVQFDEPNFNDVVENILKGINAEGEKYTEEPVSDEGSEKYLLRLYHGRKGYPPKWRSFLNRILPKDSIIKKLENFTNSFILFVGYAYNLFEITGGGGSFALEPYISQTFGIEILTRIIKKDSKVIKQIQDRGVTGAILGQSRFYRGDQRLSDENQFGKIYKQVTAQLDEKILKDVFGFKSSDLKRAVTGCLAKPSFQINKAIDFHTMLRLVEKLSLLMEKEQNFSINNVHLISRRNINNFPLIKNLEDTLVQTIYDNYLQNTPSDFDFCHKEFEKYFTAQEYKVFISGKKDPIEFSSQIILQDLIQKIKKEGHLLCVDAVEFKHSVLYQIVQTFDEDGKSLTKGNVLSHLHGEVKYNGRTYFLIDGEWYEIKPDFIQTLNAECKSILNQVLDNSLIENIFDIEGDENIFNATFIGQPGMLVFDTITPDNIEACDILKFNDHSIYLIHVKKGFDNSVRDLAYQIVIAAKRIQHDIKSGYAYINNLEIKTRKGVNSKSDFNNRLSKQSFPANGIKEIFETKKEMNICFCLAFVDTAKTKRCVKNDIEAFGSNIAKYCLIELKKEINGMGFGFRVIQLNRTN